MLYQHKLIGQIISTCILHSNYQIIFLNLLCHPFIKQVKFKKYNPQTPTSCIYFQSLNWQGPCFCDNLLFLPFPFQMGVFSFMKFDKFSSCEICNTLNTLQSQIRSNALKNTKCAFMKHYVIRSEHFHMNFIKKSAINQSYLLDFLIIIYLI